MTKDVVLLIGVPASGKSWVASRLTDKFEYVPHDEYTTGGYREAILQMALNSHKPILIETPFSMRIMDQLEAEGLNVRPVFVIEDSETLHQRYYERVNVAEHTIRGHLTRQQTYKQRAQALLAFYGNSTEVFEYLRELG